MNLETELDTKRIQSLTDATFAVAMTILILDVKIPPGLNRLELKEHFFKHSLQELFIYFIGFTTLGIFWIGSHFHHHHLLRTDRVSSWMNIFFLMFICMIPFSIGFLIHYRHEKLSIIFYSVNLIISGIANYFMLWYAWKKNYLKPYYSKKHFKDSRRRIFIPIYFYVFIIVISFFFMEIALYSFLLPLIIHLIPEKANDQTSEQ